ncbi:tetratricopeptide repeat protein [Labilibaculum sp.]|uniref:tetratricopeptide repeat protein n=1 Tax=Labilibaculum sp. TaxID=2060723 RepID=UPI003567A9E7
MKKFILHILILFSIFGSQSAFSQNNLQTESQLAFNFFRDKEYKPASSLFFNLHKITRSRTYFNYYIDCLIQLEDYQEAERSIKKEIKKNPDDQSFKIDLGYLYQKAGRNDENLQQYNEVLDDLAPIKSEITNTANAFIRKREYDFAIRTYQKGRILMQEENLFHLEMANIFLSQRNFEKMVTEYLLALSIDSSQLNSIQNHLQSALLQDIDSSLDPILKNQLLQKIQTETSNITYKELLQWYFMQKKQFKAAFRQAKAIDLMGNEDGYRLIYLATAARTNDDFETALRCYQQIIAKGPSSRNYLTAQMGYLETQYLIFQKQSADSILVWTELSKKYEQFLDQKKDVSLTSSAIIQYAHINSFYLNQSSEAIAILKKALNTGGLPQQKESELKLELADIMLFADEKWDAILLYAQIEKSNKNNPIGFEAKYKKAKVSYYMGELKWAKAQLDALKGSTSKLIANDALALSQLISNNTSLDTTYTAMKIYAEAEFLIYQKKDSLAISKLDELLKNHPGHSLTDEVYYLKFEIYRKGNNTEQALLCLSKIIEEHPYESLAAKALFKQAELYEEEKKKEKAMVNFKKIVTEYSNSIFSVEALKKLNQLRR